MVNKTNIQADSMVSAERRRIIWNWAMQYGSVKVMELAEALNVGENTIRNDLNRLQKEGKLIRVHGGAMPKAGSVSPRPYSETKSTHINEKNKIGIAALEYVPDSGTIFVGPGTTTYQMITRLSANKQLRVITNSLDVAAYIASHDIALVDFMGGSIRSDSLASDLSLSEDAVESLYWDVLFTGAPAIDATRGITTIDRSGARWERLIADHARKVVVLCDSSKLGQFSYAQVGPVSLMNVLITDSGITSELKEHLTDEGVKVVIAD